MQKLFDLFDEIGLPYYRQGSLSDEDYKPEFFTFWNFNTPFLRHSDNDAKEHALYVQVGYYTNDAKKIYTRKNKDGSIEILSPIDDFCIRANASGWKVQGKPNDANADKDGFFGRVVDIIIKEKSED